ncbi:DUF397 domain-containing protein [Streptacidiphilus melanogenes]
MRDSKDPDGAILRFSAATWTDFLTCLCEGTLIHIDANVPPPVTTAPSIR